MKFEMMSRTNKHPEEITNYLTMQNLSSSISHRTNNSLTPTKLIIIPSIPFQHQHPPVFVPCFPFSSVNLPFLLPFKVRDQVLWMKKTISRKNALDHSMSPGWIDILQNVLHVNQETCHIAQGLLGIITANHYAAEYEMYGMSWALLQYPKNQRPQDFHNLLVIIILTSNLWSVCAQP